MPAGFCSALARNVFHDGVYQTAIAAAKSNNEAASGYLRQLQSLYDAYQIGQDYDALNTLAAEARVFHPEAANAFAKQSALVEKFGSLMAVPIQPCRGEK